MTGLQFIFKYGHFTVSTSATQWASVYTWLKVKDNISIRKVCGEKKNESCTTSGESSFVSDALLILTKAPCAAGNGKLQIKLLEVMLFRDIS